MNSQTIQAHIGIITYILIIIAVIAIIAIGFSTYNITPVEGQSVTHNPKWSDIKHPDKNGDDWNGKWTMAWNYTLTKAFINNTVSDTINLCIKNKDGVGFGNGKHPFNITQHEVIVCDNSLALARVLCYYEDVFSCHDRRFMQYFDLWSIN